MGSANLTERIRILQGRKETLEAELKLVADELAACEGRLKAERERAAAVEAACRANKFLHDRRTRRLAEYFKGKGLLITSLQETTPLLKTRYKIAKMIYGAQDALVPVLKVLYGRKVDKYDLAGLDRFLTCSADSGLNAKLFQPYRLFHLGALQAEFGEYLKTEFGVRNAAANGAR